MSIDGRFIKLLTKELDIQLNTGRIQKISQLGKTDFLFSIRKNSKTVNLYISLSTSLARMNITKNNYSNDYIPGGFCMFLRKHLEGGFIKTIKALNDDRIIEIQIQNKNNIGDLTTYYLIQEMFSRYTNMIITDNTKKILNAYKHISPFDNSNRTIANGAIYDLPEDKRLFQGDLEGIKSLFQSETDYLKIVKSIKGISPVLAKYIVNKANYNNYNMYEIYKEILNQELNPTMAINNKIDFYYIDIFNKNQKYFKTLSELIDNYYLEASSIERVKQIYKHLNQFTKQELKRKKNKLEKLHTDLNRALNNNILRIKGDLLIANQHNIYRGASTFTAYSYELKKDIEITLDNLLNPIQNANKYYKKYKKQKTAVNYIREQIEITLYQINYLEDIFSQINNTYSLSDLAEIEDELRNNKFLPKKKKTISKKKPNYNKYYDELGILILVGKNNLQNNYLTHKYARKDYWWFHTKKQSGSHVIVASTNELEEITIRTAANLSAYFSKSKQSNSVQVDYTRVKNLKKVPGIYGSYVTYTKQKTIFINPNLDLINKLKKG